MDYDPHARKGARIVEGIQAMRPFSLTNWDYLKYIGIAWLIMLAWGGSFTAHSSCQPQFIQSNFESDEVYSRNMADPLLGPYRQAP